MRDMKYYQYRQEELAEYIWKHGFQSTYVSYELKLVALYIANKYSLSEGELAASLQEFLRGLILNILRINGVFVCFKPQKVLLKKEQRFYNAIV